MRTPVGLALAVIGTAVTTLQEREAQSPSAGTVRVGHLDTRPDRHHQPRAAVQATPEPAAPLTRQQRRLLEQRARRNRG